ncbi:D-Ala-D-Ala carboxypeptidase family metallohydrolase [Methylolobus aquaticus]
MGDLSVHFSKAEFACHCGCGFGTRPGDVSPRLLVLLEQIRQQFDAPVTVVSGCRCQRHNRNVGGAAASQHLRGTAADIKVQGVTPRQVADWLCQAYPRTYGVGRYRTWTHVDVRLSPSRWGTN